MKLGGSAAGFLSPSIAAMEEDILSNLTSVSGEHAASASSARNDDVGPGCDKQAGTATRKKRGLPCNPDPDAEVVALSPRSLMGTNKFTCEVCNKGFRRDQNLQLHRRGHNLPWKLKQRKKDEPSRRKVYVCPEPACAHHEPSRALGDLTGIKKHYFRKHGEKRWKCERCEKRYAVRSDWKAHSKVCGTREYKCDCGTVFSRRDSFITHRAFCDALTHETMAATAPMPPPPLPTSLTDTNTFFFAPPSATSPSSSSFFPHLPHFSLPGHSLDNSHGFHSLPPLPIVKPEPENYRVPTPALFGQDQQIQLQPPQGFCFPTPNPSSSATALLQRATMMGSRPRDEHESIDLLQDMDMDMNMMATMMMSSIPAEAGLCFGSSSRVDGILDPKGGAAGLGATRDFLNLSRGFPLPPQPKVDLVGIRSGYIGAQMPEEDQGGNDNNGQHQHHIWFTE